MHGCCHLLSNNNILSCTYHLTGISSVSVSIWLSYDNSGRHPNAETPLKSHGVVLTHRLFFLFLLFLQTLLPLFQLLFQHVRRSPTSCSFEPSSESLFLPRTRCFESPPPATSLSISSDADSREQSFSTSAAHSDVCRMTLIGRIGAEPVMKQTKSGKDFLIYKVATNNFKPAPKEGGEWYFYALAVHFSFVG